MNRPAPTDAHPARPQAAAENVPSQKRAEPVPLPLGWWLWYAPMAAALLVALVLSGSLAPRLGGHSTVIFGVFAAALGVIGLVFYRVRRDFLKERREATALREVNAELEARVRQGTAERTQSDAARQRVSAHFNEIVSSTMDAIVSVDGDKKITLFNTGAEKLFQCPASEAMGGSIDRFLPVRLREEYGKDLAGLGLNDVTGRPREGLRSWRGLRADGAEFPIEMSISRLETGQPRQVTLILRDMTERQRVEEALRTAEERFSKAFHASPLGIAISTYPEGLYVDVNEQFSKLLGYSREEVLGRRAVTLGVWSRPEQRAAIVRRIEAGETVRDEVCLLRTKAGELRTTVAAVERIVLGNQPCLLFINYDISARQQAQQDAAREQARFRFIFDSMPVGITWMERGNWASRMVNPAHVRISGVPADQCQRMDLYRLATHPEDRARHDEFHQQLSAGERDFYRMEKRYLRADGTIFWAELTVRIFRDPAGGVAQEISTLVDVTPHKLAEANLRKLEEQYRQAQKMEAMGTMAGGIAHDFNNMLTAIIGYTEMAKGQLKNDPNVDEYLSSVLQAGVRARDLVRHILTFSRQPTEQRRPVRLDHVVTEALKLLRATIPSTVEFDLDIGTELPVVLADTTQIHQVLMNLCTNAAQAMSDRPGRLAVRLDTCTLTASQAEANPNLRPGAYVRLTVSDTGHGMDQATLNRIFEPFFTTKGPGEGTGLGLSVVYGILHSYEGAMTVESQVGEGTTFHLYFPVHTAGATEMAAPVAGIPGGKGERILLVDDERLLAVLGQKMLERLNYSVVSKSSVVEALALVRANPAAFDLVITDLTMPGMIGTEFARLLLEIRPDLPIILTTGYTASLTEERVRAMGIRELLLKPQTVQSLGTAVHRALVGKKLT